MALIVGIARGIQVVLEEGHILDTIINALSSPLQAFNPLVGAIFISIIVGIIHFFIPSGSGLAYATMPIIGLGRIDWDQSPDDGIGIPDWRYRAQLYLPDDRRFYGGIGTGKGASWKMDVFWTKTGGSVIRCELDLYCDRICNWILGEQQGGEYGLY